MRPKRHQRFLWRRDGGICQDCRSDTSALRSLLGRFRQRYGREAWRELEIRMGVWHRVELFDADHMMRLADGGSSSPDNLQTLCVFCHRAKTAAEIRHAADVQRQAQNRVPVLVHSIAAA